MYRHAIAYRMYLHGAMLHVWRRVDIKLAVTTTVYHIIEFCSVYSYQEKFLLNVFISYRFCTPPTKNKRMRASCVVLVLAVLLSPTLAKPTAYVDRDGQSDYLQYLLRGHGNGKQIILSLLKASYQFQTTYNCISDSVTSNTTASLIALKSLQPWSPYEFL